MGISVEHTLDRSIPLMLCLLFLFCRHSRQTVALGSRVVASQADCVIYLASGEEKSNSNKKHCRFFPLLFLSLFATSPFVSFSSFSLASQALQAARQLLLQQPSGGLKSPKTQDKQQQQQQRPLQVKKKRLHRLIS